MKRIVTVQDISCVGRCSLTVALPVISSMGVECAVLPTAMLSTHTAFNSFTCRDLTDEIAPVCDVWEKENITFDCVYTGYLASKRQLSLVCDLAERFGQNMLFVDPAMGDYGKLYKGFPDDFPAEMMKLCRMADIIVPNITEACALLSIPYREDFSDGEIRDIAKRLCAEGAKAAAITGYSTSENNLGVLKYDSEKDTFFTHLGERVITKNPYHGTGDLFASVCVGGIMSGISADDSLAMAADFTAECVRHTEKAEDGRWYGVNFEDMTGKLLSMMKEHTDA